MNVNFEEYIAETMRKLEDTGLLLVSTNKQGKNNVMTIGWGLIGMFWGKPVFMVSIRTSSYTHELIEDSGEFTINVPEEGMSSAVQYCGEVSGRDHDKFSECKLNLLKSKFVKPPIIQECRLHYECRVVHEFDVIPRSNLLRYFVRVIAAQVEEIFHHHSDKYRSLYFGEILAVY
jgi:flavin reductase (DIM6/NTAB) family NADH-FMN oxidoreductase RutF